jgi:hypothetical protein
MMNVPPKDENRETEVSGFRFFFCQQAISLIFRLLPSGLTAKCHTVPGTV